MTEEAEQGMYETDEAWQEWLSEFDEPFAFVVDGHGVPWVLFGTEDGDWYASRPPHEDDERDVDGHTPTPPPIDAGVMALPARVIEAPRG